jgi:hypothetical protein
MKVAINILPGYIKCKYRKYTNEAKVLWWEKEGVLVVSA